MSALAPDSYKQWPARFEMLDGLRGLAAIAVVLHHLGAGVDGHFAVMVFFVISGYCISASADSCWSRGHGFGAFMLRRARRIYPPYLLALTFFAVTRYAKVALTGSAPFSRTPVEWLQNATLTQWFTLIRHPVQMPGQNPTLFVSAFWSLNYEEQFYLVTGLCLLLCGWRRMPLLVPIVCLAVAGLAWNWIVPGGFIYGWFVEYWVHFALGSCLFLALCKCPSRQVRLCFVAVVTALGAACAIRVWSYSGDGLVDLRAMVEIAYLSFVTLALYLVRPFSEFISTSWLWRPAAALGTISYSLYLIHQFNMTLVTSVANKLLPLGTPKLAALMVAVALHVALAAAFWTVCERPFLRPSANR